MLRPRSLSLLGIIFSKPCSNTFQITEGLRLYIFRLDLNIGDKYRFYFNVPGTGQFEARPLNDSLIWKWEKERDFDFYRLSLDTSFIIGNTGDFKDFTKLYAHERSPERCEKVYVEIHKRCDSSGGFTLYYRGFLAVVDGQWNIDRCRVEIEMRIDDEYSCITENWENNEDWLEGVYTQTLRAYAGDIEQRSFTEQDAFCPAEDANNSCRAETDTQSGDTINLAEGWTEMLTEYYDVSDQGLAWDTELTTIWVREFVAGGAEPAGDGWISVSGGWARMPPLTMWTYEVNLRGWVRERKLLFPADEPTIRPARDLGSVLIQFLETYCPDLSLVSDFLNINPDDTHPDNEFYQCAEENIEYLFLVPAIDVARGDFEEGLSPSTSRLVKIKELLEDLINLFNLEIKIVDGDLRIEHASYFDGNYMFDFIADSAFSEYMRGTWKYSYLTERIPSEEVWYWPEEITDTDFVGLPILYDKVCNFTEVSGEKSFRMNVLNTDIRGIRALSFQGDPDAEAEGVQLLGNKHGIVLVSATQVQPGVWAVVSNVGLLSGEVKMNGSLALANLHECYWKYKRPFTEGIMNDEEEDFWPPQRLRRQDAFHVRMCCDDWNQLHGSDFIRTQLGWGEIETATYRDPAEILELTLNHY